MYAKMGKMISFSSFRKDQCIERFCYFGMKLNQHKSLYLTQMILLCKIVYWRFGAKSGQKWVLNFLWKIDQIFFESILLCNQFLALG